MTVIGSAGGADKCEFVKSLGADAVIDYKSGSLLKQLAAAAPKGIDVYFDNVGGDHLDAGAGLGPPERTVRDLRNDRKLQCGRADLPKISNARHRYANPPSGLHLH